MKLFWLWFLSLLVLFGGMFGVASADESASYTTGGVYQSYERGIML